MMGRKERAHLLASLAPRARGGYICRADCTAKEWEALNDGTKIIETSEMALDGLAAQKGQGAA